MSSNGIRRRARLLVALAAVLLVAAPSDASRSDIRFQRLSLEDGLSQAAVNVILQDRRGFMWFGTIEGLNRYDGYEFTTYQHDPNDPSSLSHDSVRTIIEDSDGVLWVGTDTGGLDRFNEADGSFTHFLGDQAGDEGRIDRIRCIHEDRAGIFWIGTDGGGLTRFDRRSGEIRHFTPDPSNPASLSHGHVRDVYQDSSGLLWVATEGGGLNVLNTKTGRFKHYRHDPEEPRSLASDKTLAVFEDQAGKLWIGTADAGLDRFDRSTASFEHFTAENGSGLSPGPVRTIYQDREGTLFVGTESGLNEWDPEDGRFRVHVNDPADPYSLGNDTVISLYQDRGGVMWVGTFDGLSKWNPSTGTFPRFQARPGEAGRLSHRYVTSFAQGPGDTIYVGTLGGLNVFDRSTGLFRNYRQGPGRNSLPDDRVFSLWAADDETLWVGTMGGGVSRFDIPSGRFTTLSHDPQDPSSLGHNGVTSLFQDSAGTLWAGTYRGGLNRLNEDGRSFTRYRFDASDPSSISSDRIVAIRETLDGQLWIGTDGGGLNLMDRETGTFTRIQHDLDDPQSLASDHAWTISEGPDGNLWIGTQGGGLNRWLRSDLEQGKPLFKRYLKKDGLLSNVIYAMLWDETGLLWLSTNRGIAVFNPSTDTFRNYNTSHGLQSEEFNFAAALRTGDGYMFFGGISGFNAFYPGNIRSNLHVPPVVLTRVLKLNREVSFDRHISDLEQLELTHRDSMVTFDFAALDFTAPDKNRFRYKLEGFNSDWVELGTRKRATYTNLDSGQYRLRVQAANNDGVWNLDGIIVDLKVLPPPWATWWAYGVYGVFLLAIAGYYTSGQLKKRARTRQLAHANRALAQEIDSRVAKEKALFLEKEKAQTYFQVAGVVMLVLDREGKVELINAKGCEALGYTEDEVVGENWFDRFVADPARIREAFESGRMNECTEYAVLAKDGEERLVSWQTSYLTDENGETLGTLSSGSDVTDLMKLQAEKETAESASRSKSQFLANMSHEIRTPMNGVLGMLELLMNSDLSVGQKACAEKARSSAVNLLGILNEVLDFSKIEAGKMELESVDFDLAKLVEGVLDLFRETARHKSVRLRCAPLRGRPVALRGDATRLRQILVNLVGNAVKFTDSGFVSIECRPEDVSVEEVTFRFEVRDTGIGISKEDRLRIFESFQQADGSATRTYGGTGLGLAISKAFVEMMGGTIGVDSTPGEGSSFWFEVTLERQPVESELADENDSSRLRERENYSLAGHRVLLVEDNVVNQDVARGMLESLGASVEVAGDGLAALDALEAASFDLVLMDCQMPFMDGYTATREIRRLERKQEGGGRPLERLPIAAMTAHAMEGEREKCLAAGMDDYLSKPFTRSQLRNLLVKWLPAPAEDRAEIAPLPAAEASPQSAPGTEPPETTEASGEAIEVPAKSHPPINRLNQQRYLWGPLSPEGAARVLDLYLANSPQMMEKMELAVRKRDFEALADVAHKFRSSSAMVGADRHAALCGRIEEVARNDDESALELFEEARGELERVLSALREQRPRAAAAG